MTMRTNLAVVLLSSFVLFACGDDDEAAVAPTTVAPSESPATTAASDAPDEAPDPCSRLTEAIVRATFSVPEATTIDHRLAASGRYPSCRYTWEKPNADEVRREIQALQQERARQMMKQLQRGKRTQALLDMAMDLPRVDNRAALNFGPTSESPEAARATFESGMATLVEGITHEVEVDDTLDEVVQHEMEGEEVTFRADMQDVDGVGDEARWIPTLNELAILHGTELIYLRVEIETDRAANLAHAKRLAAALLH